MNEFKKLTAISNNVDEQIQICINWVNDVLQIHCENLQSAFESGENIIKLIELTIPGDSIPDLLPLAPLNEEDRNREIRRCVVHFAASRGVAIHKSSYIDSFIEDLGFNCHIDSIYGLLYVIEAIAEKAKVNLQQYYVKGSKPLISLRKTEFFLSEKERMITMLPIGLSGTGKSTFINAWFEEEKCLTSKSAKSTTKVVQLMKKTKGDQTFLRNAFDVPGLYDSQGISEDDSHLKQIAEVLLHYENGLNVVAIFIHKGDVKFNLILQKMLKLLNALINDANLWDHLCVIVTHASFEDEDERDDTIESMTKGPDSLRGQIISFIKNITRLEGEDPEVPFFFVNNYRNKAGNLPMRTREEIQRFDEWACGHTAFKTNSAQTIDSIYMHKETEITEPTIKRGEFEKITITREGEPEMIIVRKKIHKKVWKKRPTFAIEYREKWIKNGRRVDFFDVVTLGVARLFERNRKKVIEQVQVQTGEEFYEEDEEETVEVLEPSGRIGEPQIEIIGYFRIDVEEINQYQIGWRYEAANLERENAEKIPNTQITTIKKKKLVFEKDQRTLKSTEILETSVKTEKELMKGGEG